MIINLGILAHVDAGKTTLTEQLLYNTGATRSIGRVDDGTSHTDFLEVERKRGISVKASIAQISRDENLINIVDTPGHTDFASEIERSLSVLDTGVLLISAVEGIQAQTEVLYDALKKANTNIIIFINKIDRAGSDIKGVLEGIKDKFNKNAVLMTDYQNEAEKDCTVSMRNLSDESFKSELLETLSEVDESIMEDYLSDNEIGDGRIKDAFKKAFLNSDIIPAFCGSAILGQGINELLDFIFEYGKSRKNREDDKLSGVVFKIEHDKSVGRISYVRLFGGELKNRDQIILKDANDEEKTQKITQIRRYNGIKYTDIGKVGAGDIAAICGLSDASIGDIIGELDKRYDYKMSAPIFKVGAIPPSPDKLIELKDILSELCAEDPKLDMQYLQHEKELNVNITGPIQLEILNALIKERYGMDVLFTKPSVIYKETPMTKGVGTEAYTMPKPCWAVVSLEIEPLKRGSGLQFSSVVSNEKILYRYQTHVKISVKEALKQGLYNWEVIDLSVKLVDGSHHLVHTHPLDFFLATPIAVMKALENTKTELLEPMQKVRFIIPEEFSGKIIGDIIAMRGEYDSPIIKSGVFETEALLPIASSMEYSIKLASMTSGKGVMSSTFAGYKPCPLELGQVAKRDGINPLDRAKWILYRRGAITQ